MGTKTKSASKSASKKSSSKPKGVAHSFDRVPYAPKDKVKVYDAFGVPPEGMPPGKAVATGTVKANGSLDVRVPKKGAYLLAAETDDGGVVRFHFHVK